LEILFSSVIVVVLNIVEHQNQSSLYVHNQIFISLTNNNQKRFIFQNMGKLVEEFNGYREKMNDRIMETANTNIKRFFALDTTSYADGALDVKTKEMLGLVASMVLRCDDCIKYHLGKCFDAGVNSDEMNEIFMIANLVGGSIVIPHYRRAVEYWDELSSELGV
jgi:AhpD family alkylhydroperoxidase